MSKKDISRVNNAINIKEDGEIFELSIDEEVFYYNSYDERSIVEARDEGISYKAYATTCNKIVIHPGDLGCPLFDYPFEDDSWGPSWYPTNVKFETIDKCTKRLIGVGIYLTEYYAVYLVGIHASGKGYMSSHRVKIKNGNEKQYQQLMDKFLDIVLFLYSQTHCLAN